MNLPFVKRWISELRIWIFKLQKSKCPITFLKILIRALHLWIKNSIFIVWIWFLIPDNIESISNHILKTSGKRSSKRSSPVASIFELFQSLKSNLPFWLKKFENWSHGGAPFWAPFARCFQNMIRNTFNIIWNQKSNSYYKNWIFYPKMKFPNQNFLKSDRALWFLEPENPDPKLRNPSFHKW